VITKISDEPPTSTYKTDAYQEVFFYRLVYNAVPRLYSTQRQDDKWTENWKGFGRNLPWPIFWHFLVGQRKIMKNLSRQPVSGLTFKPSNSQT
jgi:hypothetical protein